MKNIEYNSHLWCYQCILPVYGFIHMSHIILSLNLQIHVSVFFESKWNICIQRTSYFIFATIFSLLFRIKNVSLILYSESPMLWHTWKVILLNSEKGLYFKSLYIYSVKWIKLMWCVNLAEIILYNENKDI